MASTAHRFTIQRIGKTPIGVEVYGGLNPPHFCTTISFFSYMLASDSLQLLRTLYVQLPFLIGYGLQLISQ
jgi:hypothetical protein